MLAREGVRVVAGDANAAMVREAVAPINAT